MCFNWCWPLTEYEVDDDENSREKCKITHKHTHTRSRYRHRHRGCYYDACPMCQQCSCRYCQPHACQRLSTIGPRYIGPVGMTMAISAPPRVVSVQTSLFVRFIFIFLYKSPGDLPFFPLPFLITHLQFTALSSLNSIWMLFPHQEINLLLPIPTYSNIRVFTSVEVSLSPCHPTL